MAYHTGSSLLRSVPNYPAKSEATDNTVISFENISIKYLIQHDRINTLKEYAIQKLRGKSSFVDFFALKDVSFKIREGEIVGVVGENGAGKSTLLRVVSRVIKPTSGRVIVKGRVAPLLELGAGFHPELTGRENIFLNGTLLGYSHNEVKSLVDEIIDFSELKNFIDSPIRTYSSGMQIRLGFAVATATKPDVLIVDEVLAVGDERFQQKCLDRIATYKKQGLTMLFVSHNSNAVAKICDSALWIDHGSLRLFDEVEKVLDAYHSQK